jgi:hypothetical protein
VFHRPLCARVGPEVVCMGYRPIGSISVLILGRKNTDREIEGHGETGARAPRARPPWEAAKLTGASVVG